MSTLGDDACDEISLTHFQAVLGRVIVRARKKLGLDQTALAEKVGLTQSTWSRIERGESTMTVDQLFYTSRALYLSLDTLLHQVEVVLRELEPYGSVISSPNSTTPQIFGLSRATNINTLGKLVNSILTLEDL